VKLKASERIRIREYVRGIMAGVSSVTKFYSDNVDDSWFMFAHNRSIHLCMDDDGYWQCAVYNIRNGHIDVKDWVTVDLEWL